MPELKTILYAEDELDIQAIAKVALVTIGGFDVTFCESGIEALEAAPALLPDLILLDVMMPNLDGTETLSIMRGIDGLKDTPIIFITAKAMPSEVERFKSLGAIEVIPKPFDPLTLARDIQAIWDAHYA